MMATQVTRFPVVGPPPLSASVSTRSTMTQPEPSSPSTLAIAAALGGSVVGCIVVGALSGLGLDALFGTAPWLLLVGVLLGVAAAGVAMMKVLNQMNQGSNRGR